MINQIKENAKKKIAQKIVFLFIIYFIPVAASTTLGVVFPFFGIFSFLIVLLASFGVNNVYLKVARLQSADYKDIGIAFSANAIQRYLIVGLYTIGTIFLYTLLLIVPGIIKAYEYSQTFFIAIDHPELNAKEVLAQSRKMMYGKKFDLFKLQLSFIGWAILSIITFGISNIYLLPYYQMALTEFYLELK